MTRSSHQWYIRYRPWRRHFEAGAWVALFGLTAAFNSVVEIMDLQRTGRDAAPWEPVVWETSSAVGLLLLVPALVWLTARFPPAWHDWRRLVLVYFAASIVYTVVHVLIMVGLRHLAYGWMDTTYRFGPWVQGLWYEYLKDARTFVACIAVIEVYRFVLRRLKGEARMLDAPDDRPSPDAEDGTPAKRFLVRMLGREFLVPADQISSARAAGNYVNLHVGDRDYPLRSTLAELARRLDPERFLRVHRSWLVNLEQVASIEPLESGDARIHLHDGRVVPCSRRHRDALRARIADTAPGGPASGGPASGVGPP